MCQKPFVCHQCWPKRNSWTEPCEHAMEIVRAERVRGALLGGVEQHKRIAEMERKLAAAEALVRKCPDCDETIINSQDCPLCENRLLETVRDELRAENTKLKDTIRALTVRGEP